MSVELIAVVVSACGIVLTLGTTMVAGFAWCVRRIDAVDGKLTARIDAVDEKLTARIDAVDEKLTARIDVLASEMTDVKIAVARLEGPERRFYAPAR